MGVSGTHPSILIANALEQIYKSRLTTTSGGNISIKGEDNVVWITPAGVDKGSLSRKDIVKVKTNGDYEGRHKPSSEFPFHTAIYNKRPDIKAIIHAHPPACVAFSIVGQIPDTTIIPQAKQLCGSVGFAPYRLPGSEALGQSIAEEFQKGFNSVIMENHGIVIGGSTLSEAFMRFETLEFCAKTLIRSKMLGKSKSLSNTQLGAFEALKNGFGAIPEHNPSEEELLLRHEMANIIQRACRQGLMVSSFGTISHRLSETAFLINPTNSNRREITPGDLVFIDKETKEAQKEPSRATPMHQEIYKNHKNINCIISTQSPNAMAFAITHSKMDTRTIPESYVLLEDIPLLPYGDPLKRGGDAVKVLGKHTPIGLFQNNSILVTGSSLLEAFDRLEVAEFSAKSIIDSKALGVVNPIKENEIKDLRAKFLKD